MDLYGEFEWRGLVYDATQGFRDVVAREPVTVYGGFDPTAASLHVGHLLPALTLARMQRMGHSPIAVVGGGTGLIGDPSGKSTERTLLTAAQVEANVVSIRGQLSRLLDFTPGPHAARLVNNADWLTTMTAMEFLRDVGKYFSVNALLTRDSVKRRLAGEDGISYTEFSYSLLQAYDFLTLFDRYGCSVQIGGSDQWGNIVAGCDLIRRLRAGKAHGLVMPLLTTAAGTKFGKTEGGAIWLDPTLTRPYEFYQFWLQAEDHEVVKYLKFFTFFDQARIRDLEDATSREPERRQAQRELARAVTMLVHGEGAARDAETASGKMFGAAVAAMSVTELLEVFPNVPSSTVRFPAEGWSLVDLLAVAGVATSKSEATRLIRGGGISVNDRRITDEKERLGLEQAIEGQLFLVRKGKRDNYLIRIDRG
jgi:tyrosyl-tRNA synthetase